eukprot:6159247-Amphidinium_carterae.2
MFQESVLMWPQSGWEFEEIPAGLIGSDHLFNLLLAPAPEEHCPILAEQLTLDHCSSFDSCVAGVHTRGWHNLHVGLYQRPKQEQA